MTRQQLVGDIRTLLAQLKDRIKAASALTPVTFGIFLFPLSPSLLFCWLLLLLLHMAAETPSPSQEALLSRPIDCKQPFPSELVCLSARTYHLISYHIRGLDSRVMKCVVCRWTRRGMRRGRRRRRC